MKRPRPDAVEDALGRLENEAAAVHRKLATHSVPSPLTSVERNVWATFLRSLEYRGASRIEALDIESIKMVEDVVGEMRQKAGNGGQPSRLEDALAEIDFVALARNTHRELLLRHARAPFVADEILSQHWSFIDVDPPFEFLTSDRPLLHLGTDTHYYAKLFPVTPRRLFVSTPMAGLRDDAKLVAMLRAVVNLQLLLEQPTQVFAHAPLDAGELARLARLWKGPV